MTWLRPSPPIIPHPNTVKFPHFPILLPSSFLSLSLASHSESRAVSLSSLPRCGGSESLHFQLNRFVRTTRRRSWLPHSCLIPVLLSFDFISFDSRVFRKFRVVRMFVHAWVLLNGSLRILWILGWPLPSSISWTRRWIGWCSRWMLLLREPWFSESISVVVFHFLELDLSLFSVWIDHYEYN